MPDGSERFREAARSAEGEQRMARVIAIGLPIVTIVGASAVSLTTGPATGILVLSAGLLLGVIALLWSSLRILTGDAILSPEIEDLDMAAQGGDALAIRKKMLLRALKDLENERALGKIESDDFEQIAQTHRAELKAVLKKIEESLAPHRSKAEALAKAHLAKASVFETETSGADGNSSGAETTSGRESPSSPENEATSRLECPKCQASNERDAKFCKECAAPLTSVTKEKTSTASEINASKVDSNA